MNAHPEPGRVRALEAQIHELEIVHTQLVAYAEDLNRTYIELRLRLQQMTTLSAIATRLARARTVEGCAKTCLEGVGILFARTVGRVYTENRQGGLKLSADRVEDDLRSYSDVFAKVAAASAKDDEVATAKQRTANGELHLFAVPLITRGKAFGALVVGRTWQPFNEHDVHLVELLGHNAAVAIANARLYQETRRLAVTDPTTGVFNFRYFRRTLAQEVQKARRFGYPVALVMSDIDHFKSFNDSYGHPRGNIALQTVARVIQKSLRQTDTVARYGGEEFAAILPGCDRSALAQVAEKIRESVARAPIKIGGRDSAHLTISVGGAWQDGRNADAGALLATADEALYTAKALGRNRAYVRP